MVRAFRAKITGTWVSGGLSDRQAFVARDCALLQKMWRVLLLPCIYLLTYTLKTLNSVSLVYFSFSPRPLSLSRENVFISTARVSFTLSPGGKRAHTPAVLHKAPGFLIPVPISFSVIPAGTVTFCSQCIAFCKFRAWVIGAAKIALWIKPVLWSKSKVFLLIDIHPI